MISLNYEQLKYNTIQYNTIQYNTIVYWHSPGGAFQWQCDYKKIKKNKKIKIKKLIKIREVVNNSIKKKECGEQSNINIPI